MITTAEQRKTRSGKGLLPPNPTQWGNEHSGLDLRDRLGLSPHVPLPNLGVVFGTILPHVQVLPHGEVPVAQKFIDHFRNAGRSAWSGLGIRMEDGTEFVIYNDSHLATRTRATLMEEFFHICLDHPRSELRLLTGNERSNRTYSPEIEDEAYGSGAAALAPFAGLKTLIVAGATTTRMADHFAVSTSLISYRLKVTRLYNWRAKYGK